ncbi:xanthine/CO dehydrogenase XdhC/CoxF family maturation factor [Lewinella marina]|uniref:XshC-Cox1 family protein n=1 Tax=Neolewinella marina TaxID=438751 RepID=A0A2G0CID9_9BACT|nr:XdhC family protein [Neolewinella marina]NJB85121.1 xanthine/CO dehydrogenase XdhC/CoxF family maturation factor [Neolewinella marina]PHK99742.1 XshC-Cox1 family protein [Neolewinella marina]
MKEIRNIISLYDEFRSSGTACALATVVSVEGSSYRRIGARLLVGADGRYTGGISGGCLEGDALRRAQRAIHEARPSKRVYDTLEGEDREIGIGLGCNGRIEVLFVPLDFADTHNQVEVLRARVDIREPRILVQTVEAPPGEPLDGVLSEVPPGAVDLPDSRSRVIDYTDAAGRPGKRLYERLRPELHLIVIGDNYDILPLVTTVRHLGWRCSVVGTRRKFNTALSAAADGLYDYGQAGALAVDDYTAVACMSHDFNRDKEMVEVFLPKAPPYLGLLGPRKRTLKMDAELRSESGLDLLGYDHLYSPIGLDIGAETPEEISVSVVAEIIRVFRERPGTSLREKPGAIHARY